MGAVVRLPWREVDDATAIDVSDDRLCEKYVLATDVEADRCRGVEPLYLLDSSPERLAQIKNPGGNRLTQ